jgi:hypothetical protein
LLLHSNRAPVERLLDRAEAALRHHALHQQVGPQPALWLVGNGVYLTSNRDPSSPARKKAGR